MTKTERARASAAPGPRSGSTRLAPAAVRPQNVTARKAPAPCRGRREPRAPHERAPESKHEPGGCRRRHEISARLTAFRRPDLANRLFQVPAALRAPPPGPRRGPPRRLANRWRRHRAARGSNEIAALAMRTQKALARGGRQRRAAARERCRSSILTSPRRSRSGNLHAQIVSVVRAAKFPLESAAAGLSPRPQRHHERIGGADTAARARARRSLCPRSARASRRPGRARRIVGLVAAARRSLSWRSTMRSVRRARRAASSSAASVTPLARA